MFKIAWNDGHTLKGLGTGAEGLIKETDRNRIIGKQARHILSTEYENVLVINCTIDYSSDDMFEAVKKANDNNCDLFISNHVNSGGGVGFESFYSRYSTQSNINKCKIIHDTLCATKSCLKNRRYCDDYSYKKFDLYVLRNTKMHAILCEIGFVDNQTCINAVDNMEVARAYAEGIAKAYGLKKIKKNEEVKEKFKMKYAVCYCNEVDERSAKLLRDYLGDEVQSLDARIKMSWNGLAEKGLINIGGNSSDGWGFSSYATHWIKGDNRYSTAQLVSDICSGKRKLDDFKIK